MTPNRARPSQGHLGPGFALGTAHWANALEAAYAMARNSAHARHARGTRPRTATSLAGHHRDLCQGRHDRPVEVAQP
jgi:hypothetical protein